MNNVVEGGDQQRNDAGDRVFSHQRSDGLGFKMTIGFWFQDEAPPLMERRAADCAG